ncbi:MAG TPA: phosphoserine transaminase [Rhizomicrobium sp.]
MTGNRPAVRPARPFFSSGPCAKRPGWSPEILRNALLGRSHRSKPGKAKLREAIARTQSLLGIPGNYRVGIVPASDTGAVEMAMWSLLGPRPADLFAWESFGEDWAADAVKQLNLKDARIVKAEYGALPDLGVANFSHDVVFLWNGTTSGVRVPDGDWIADDRQGLTICDATSAAFAMDIPWSKLDAATFSWQKAVGGEAGHGMLVLSPRAIARLEAYTPPWPLPKIFRLTKGGKLLEAIFEGETINTPSMLAVEDYLDALSWAESLGGLRALIARTDANFRILARWVGEAQWVEFLAADPRTRSSTSVCLKIVDPWFVGLGLDAQSATARKIADVLEKEEIAFDIAAHRNAPPGLRIWCGATVEREDLQALTPWLDWAWGQVRQ